MAVDTANEYMTVLAVKGERVETSYLPNCAMRHSTELMKEVDGVLSRLSLSLAECDFFAAVVGAGSFTGIRIGVSAVKGFCLAFGKPSLAITSFDLAAYNAKGRAEKTLCIVDALHDAYYVCGYEGERVSLPPAYLSEEEVFALLQEGYALRTVGRGEKLLNISSKAPVELCDPVDGLLCAVRKKAAEGAFGELNALYVRKSSAELNLGK